jgi:Protein of unknown function (DUF1559)
VKLGIEWDDNISGDVPKDFKSYHYQNLQTVPVNTSQAACFKRSKGMMAERVIAQFWCSNGTRPYDRFVPVFLRAVIALIASLSSSEDPRTTSDKEGRYIPFWSLGSLGKAMHNYQTKHGRLPPAAVYSEDGTPLLSWRVLLLPHLQHGELFQKFNLDEPWDSPQNLALLAKMPDEYSDDFQSNRGYAP